MFFEFKNEGFLDANGSRSFEFSCRVTSFDFSASISDIWFNDDVLVSFEKDLAKLANCEISTAKLTAMSDFELKISKEDSLGHFTAVFALSSTTQGNSASLVTKLDTQSVIDFSNELKLTIQRT
jgi:hypothetical protein